MRSRLYQTITKHYKNKRGVSPLIATVLLIAFAVALGAIVMNWGRNYIESQQTSAEVTSTLEIECSTNVEFDITNVDYNANTTLDASDGGLEITLENKRSKILRGFAFKLFDQNNRGITITKVSTKTNTTNNLNALEIKTYTITASELSNYDLSNLGTLKKIVVVPYILPGENPANDIQACVNYEVSSSYGDISWPSYQINFTS